MMECIIEFFHDNYQEKIRNLCQMQSEKYEEALERYKKAILVELDLIKKCRNKNKSCQHRAKPNIEEFHFFIARIRVKEIEDFFDCMINDVYINWINSKSNDAIRKFEDLLNEYELLDFKGDISSNILFRGRISEDILTPWDMFHIPFNKRYLISNQRYSLTGQPLLYLGMSVLDVIAEINPSLDDISNLQVSTYKFSEPFKVYDLRNEFYKYIKHIPFLSFVEGSNKEDAELTVDLKKFKKEFFKFLLSSICSFARRKELRKYTFCEEYVIPQLLAQIIKKNELQGIIYSSTQLTNKENDKKYNTKYKDNVAIFTNFNREHVYDRELYDKVEISNPVRYEKIKEVTLDHIHQICDEIIWLDQEQKYQEYHSIGLNLELDFSKIKINDQFYFDHRIGKLHIYMVYNFLFELRNKHLLGGK